MFRRKRKGMALITVVLISALLFVSIIGIILKVVPENKIIAARSASQRALSVADAGASQVFFDLRNFGTDEEHPNEFDPDSTAPLATSIHYLTSGDSGDIIYLINASSGGIINPSNGEYITNPSPPSDESFETSYQAKIKVISNDTTNKILDVDLYTLGTVTDRANGNVLARKAIKTSFKIDYVKKPIPGSPGTPGSEDTPGYWKPGPPSSIANYALFSGANISFNGEAQSANGDIHACGDIDLGPSKSHIRVLNGDAEAEGGISGKGQVTGDTYEGDDAPTVVLPKLNIEAYKNLADAFRSGSPPYDGTPVSYTDPDGNVVELHYPNINYPIVLGVIQSYLGAPGTSSTLSGINDFYHDLMSGAFTSLSPGQLIDLQTYAKSIAYYVEGPVTISGQFECIGTLVVDGDLHITGNSQVGDPDYSGAAAILVNGDIWRANGNADLYGLFYSTGSMRGNGTFLCEGSIITLGSIDLNGTFDVHYVPITWNPNLAIDNWEWVPPVSGTPEEPGTPAEPGTPDTYSYSVDKVAESGSYIWKEVSFDEFDNLH
jgi:hypothetical protein